MLAVLGSAALLVALSIIPGQKAVGKQEATPVSVVNTPLPVSQQGTSSVNVTNSSLAVTVSGTPNVNASGSSVVVANSVDNSDNPIPLLTRDADNPVANALQVELCSEDGGSTFCDSRFNSPQPTYTVPSGERFAVQFVSGTCGSSTGTVYSTEVQTSLGASTVDHEIMLSPISGSVESLLSQQVRFYADPSSTIQLFYTTSGSAGHTWCDLELSGYTVPYTAP